MANPSETPSVPVKERSGSFFQLLASPYLWMVVGLLGVLCTEPLRDLVSRYHRGGITEGKAASGQDAQRDHFERLLNLGTYTFEHLSSVIFVAMLIRLAIERQAQKEAVRGVSDAVKAEVKAAFVDVIAQVDSFNRRVGDVNSSLSQVNDRIASIQVLTGGTLYAQKLKPADRQEIAATFLNPLFFRPSYDLVVTLTPKDQDLLRVEIVSDAKLQNISLKPQAMKISAFLDNAFFSSGTQSVPRASKFHRFEFGEDTARGRELAQQQPLIVSHEGNERFVTSIGDNLVFDYDPSIMIPPEGIYFVKMFAEQQMRRSDLFFWMMQVATEKFTIEVHLDGDLTTDNFALIARPIHHVQHDDFAAKCEDRRRLSWYIERVVLPYQGVQLWWSPRPTLAAGLLEGQLVSSS